MYALACKDMGVDCGHVAKGQTKAEVLADGMQHVQETHLSDPKVMAMMKMSTDEMNTMATGLIKEIPAP